MAAEEEEQSGPGEWVISFNDCMTNMLCFFVLLISFSSFSTLNQARITGIFRTLGKPNILSNLDEYKDSFLNEYDKIIFSQKGSEMPAESNNEDAKMVASLEPINESDAFRNQKSIYIKCNELFHGSGAVLTIKGRKTLNLLAKFAKKIPSIIVIQEIIPNITASENTKNNSISRAWSVLDFLTSTDNLNKNRFRICAGKVQKASNIDINSLMEIKLFSGRAFR